VFLVGGTTLAFRPTFWSGPARANFNDSEQVDILEDTELQQSPSRRGNCDETSTSAIEDNPATDTAIAPSNDDENDPFENSNGSTTNSNDLNVTGKAFSTARLPFLDKLKTFLTALVVIHHVACAFGGCTFGGLGEAIWHLIVGEDGTPAFQFFVRALAFLDQAYFMSLFFFIGFFLS